MFSVVRIFYFCFSKLGPGVRHSPPADRGTVVRVAFGDFKDRHLGGCWVLGRSVRVSPHFIPSLFQGIPRPRATLVVNLDMAPMYGPGGMRCMAPMYGPVGVEVAPCTGRAWPPCTGHPGPHVRAGILNLFLGRVLINAQIAAPLFTGPALVTTAGWPVMPRRLGSQS
jgi:hypothetical protein